MSDKEDPERLLAEALRAQAARTPLSESGAVPPDSRADEQTDRVTGGSPTDGGFGLLSGSDLNWVLGTGSGTDQDATTLGAGAGQTTSRLPARRGIAAGWVLLLATVLGLAVGAVVGLVTLL